MKSYLILQGLFLSCLLCAGCTEIPLSPEVSALPQRYPPNGLGPVEPRVNGPTTVPRVTNELEALYRQTSGQTTSKPLISQAVLANREVYAVLNKPLLDEIAQTRFLRAYVETLEGEAKAADPNAIPRIKISAGAMTEFTKVFTKNFGKMLQGPAREALRMDNARSLDNILVDYYQDYFDGKYVTRDGVALAKPTANISLNGLELSGSVNTDTLTGLLTVFLEALHDFAQDVPVFVDADGYLNGSTNTPTCVTYDVVPKVTLPNPAYPNIDANTWKYTRYISMATSNASEALTTLILKSFGGVSAGPVVVLGKFSIGDNSTLTKAIETILDVDLTRDSEWLMYEALMNEKQKPKVVSAEALPPFFQKKVLKRPPVL
jgi:hypothetical protein